MDYADYLADSCQDSSQQQKSEADIGRFTRCNCMWKIHAEL